MQSALRDLTVGLVIRTVGNRPAHGSFVQWVWFSPLLSEQFTDPKGPTPTRKGFKNF